MQHRTRTAWKLSGRIIVFFVAVTAACSQNMLPLPESGAGPPRRAPLERTAASPSQSEGARDGAAESISGRISVSPEVSARLTGSEVLYVMARRGAGGPPLAVKRIIGPTFPMNYVLTGADQMVQGMPFSGEVSVTARIDRDGNAGPPQPGDMEGRVPQARIGATNVDITIDRVY